MSYNVLNELLTYISKYREVENMYLPAGSKLPGLSHTDIIRMIKEDPDSLAPLIENIRNNPDTLIGSTVDEPTQSYIRSLHDEWSVPESQYTLTNKDYKNVKKYFKNKKSLSELSDGQKTLVQLLAKQPDDFVISEDFPTDHDASNGYNLREQLLHRLESDNILDTYTTDMMANKEIPEDWNFQKFSPDDLRLDEIEMTDLSPQAIDDNISYDGDSYEGDYEDDYKAVEAGEEFTNEEILNMQQQLVSGENDELVNTFIDEAIEMWGLKENPPPFNAKEALVELDPAFQQNEVLLDMMQGKAYERYFTTADKGQLLDDISKTDPVGFGRWVDA